MDNWTLQTLANHERKIKALDGGIRLLNRFTLGLSGLTLLIGIVSFAAYLRG